MAYLMSAGCFSHVAPGCSCSETLKVRKNKQEPPVGSTKVEVCEKQFVALLLSLSYVVVLSRRVLVKSYDLSCEPDWSLSLHLCTCAAVLYLHLLSP